MLAMKNTQTSDSIPNPNDWLNEHGDYLYRFALVRLLDQHLAEDAVQETLLAAIKNSAGFTGKSTARTWLTGILKHKIIDLMRRAQREQPLYDDDPAEEMIEPGMDEFFDDAARIVVMNQTGSSYCVKSRRKTMKLFVRNWKLRRPMRG